MNGAVNLNEDVVSIIKKTVGIYGHEEYTMYFPDDSSRSSTNFNDLLNENTYSSNLDGAHISIKSIDDENYINETYLWFRSFVEGCEKT